MPKPTNRRVLIVDDERDLTDTLALRLTAEGGFTVSVAYDGAQGLHQARRFKPDVILLDISMPGLDGWQVCSALREGRAAPGARVVIMTAGTDKGLAARAAQEGVTEVLIKPVEDQDLLKALR